MFGICVLYVWYMYGICMIYVWYMYCILFVYDINNFINMNFLCINSYYAIVLLLCLHYAMCYMGFTYMMYVTVIFCILFKPNVCVYMCIHIISILFAV